MPIPLSDTGRVFLSRMEATYALGLMDAAQRREPRDVRVACYDERTGAAHEAQPGEVLHAEVRIRCRLGARSDVKDGWTAPASLLQPALR